MDKASPRDLARIMQEDTNLRGPFSQSEADTNLEHSSAPRSFSKVPLLAGITGIALLGVVLFAMKALQAGPGLRNGSVQNSAQLAEKGSASNFYLVKQSFATPEAAKTYWDTNAKVTKEKWAEYLVKMHDAGYDSPIWLPTGTEGPVFVLFEQKKGTKEDMEDFAAKTMEMMYKSDAPSVEVMPLDFAPTKSFFGSDESDKSEDMASVKDDKPATGSLFLLKMTVKPGEVDKYAKHFEESGGWDAWEADVHKNDMHDHMCLSTEGGQVAYEIMEAKPGVTSSDIDAVASKYVADKLDLVVGVDTVLIPNALTGGIAAAGVKPHF